MKPRNKFEKAVLAQSEKLPAISKTQMKWAFRECIDHYAHRLPKGRTTCMDCGHNWLMAEQTDHCTCPSCGAKLEVKLSYVRKVQQKQYFTVLTTSGVYQVLRMFLLVVEMEKGCKAVPQVIEIGQYWWNGQGKMAVVGIQRVLGKYLDTFSFASPMAIRRDNIAYDHISYAPIYPKSKAIDTLRRNGFNGEFHGIAPTLLIPALLSDNRAETLMKAGQYQMLRHYLKSSFDMERYWASSKICIRHGYTIPDGSMWCDHIDLLRHFGKDLNNPKYVCPQDLKAEHEKLIAKRNRQREQEEIAEKKRKAMEDETKFKELKGKFFGIAFTDGTLQVRVLESVHDHLVEGTLMHHCVFSNAYYLKENSLILSATIDGKRIETVEVNLQTLKVVQSRAVCNGISEYHNRIITLVENNANLFRQRMKAA